MFLRLLLAICWLFAFQPLAVASDARMQVDVVAATEQVEVNWLHSNVAKAAALALPQLWQRIIPASAHALIPKRVQAIRFLEKAIPTENGMRISFHQQRVMRYLKKNKLPYIAQQPALNIVVQVYNQSGQPMRQSANALLDDAAHMAVPLGYRMDDQGASLVLLWRWLDHQHIHLNVRGNSRLNEFSETRQLRGGDPMKPLHAWLKAVLLQARDAYAESTPEQPVTPSEATQSDPTKKQPDLIKHGLAALRPPGLTSAIIMPDGHTAPPARADITLILRVQRQASLADQVLFEDALKQDPRILNLSLRQVNQTGQQYRLQLKGSDDQWLTAWFARRGMILTPTIEGWVAH